MVKKYKKGQTWPKGGFFSGLDLFNSDRELREGWPTLKRKKVRKKFTMAKPGQETKFDYTYKTVKVIKYPAGKPLKTDREIRAYRKKRITGWGGEWTISPRENPFWTREKQEKWVDDKMSKLTSLKER